MEEDSAPPALLGARWCQVEITSTCWNSETRLPGIAARRTVPPQRLRGDPRKTANPAFLRRSEAATTAPVAFQALQIEARSIVPHGAKKCWIPRRVCTNATTHYLSRRLTSSLLPLEHYNNQRQQGYKRCRQGRYARPWPKPATQPIYNEKPASFGMNKKVDAHHPLFPIAGVARVLRISGKEPRFTFDHVAITWCNLQHRCNPIVRANWEVTLRATTCSAPQKRAVLNSPAGKSAFLNWNCATPKPNLKTRMLRLGTGDPVTVWRHQVLQQQTQPPNTLLNATLLAAMNLTSRALLTTRNCEKRCRRNDGTGPREATRAAILETACSKRDYLCSWWPPTSAPSDKVKP